MQKREKEPTHKERLTELWQQHPDGRGFIDAAGRAGYYIAQDNDRRPFRVITPDGQSLDLMRQIERDIKQEVWDGLKPIWAALWPEADALRRVGHDRDRAKMVPDQSDKSKDLSDSQNLAVAMIERIKSEKGIQEERVNLWSHSFTIKQPSVIYPQPAQENRSDTSRGLSDRQERAAAMIKRYR